MNEKRIPFSDDEPKHKKKSKKRGQPRADHKHEYKTVLLLNEYVNQYFPDKPTMIKRPMKICVVCGRVGEVDFDQYDIVESSNSRYLMHERKIRDEDALEKWYVNDYFDKFAKKMEEL